MRQSPFPRVRVSISRTWSRSRASRRPGYLSLAVDKAAIKPTIYGHSEFTAFITSMNTHFCTWRQKNAETLRQLTVGVHPKEFITTFAEELLTHYIGKQLIDPYDVYQHLLDYWDATMQDDCYAIAADGWKATTERVIETKKGNDGKPDKQVDKGWTCDLVPNAFIAPATLRTNRRPSTNSSRS
jgi:type I restriction enzyme M protein